MNQLFNSKDSNNTSKKITQDESIKQTKSMKIVIITGLGLKISPFP